MRKCLHLLLILTLVACGHKNEVKKVAIDFFAAVKSGNTADMEKLYPKISSLQNYRKSDTIQIEKIESLDDNNYSVSLQNSYTNGFGKNSKTNITLFLTPKDPKDISKGYIIYDSRGICDLSDDDIGFAKPAYEYAKRTGLLKGKNPTDQQSQNIIALAILYMTPKVGEFKEYLRNNFTVSRWSWESDYFGISASGQGIVKNNTPYTIPNTKYIVTFKTANGREITQEEGLVSSDDIRPYSSLSFSFFSPYVGNAKKANIRLEFDEEFVEETIARGYYK